jgi:GT2 family glycosyltransferase
MDRFMTNTRKFSVSVVIPNYNGQSLLVDTIKSAHEALVSSEIKDFEIIVSDDCSTDDSVRLVSSLFPDVILVKSIVNTGFSGNMNRGINQASKELVCFLNSDVHLAPTYFKSQLSLFENQETFGVMGAILDQETKEAQDGAKIAHIQLLRIESNKNNFSQRDVLPTMFLSGANALVRREYLIELGGFCELFNPYYSEDVDLGILAWRNGWKLYFQPIATCFHAQSSTIKKLPNKNVRMIAKRNKHFVHFLHLPAVLNWIYLFMILFNSFGQLLILNTLHMKSFIAVFKQLNKLQMERKRRRLTTKGKTLLSIKHVKKVIDGMTHITSKHAVPS